MEALGTNLEAERRPAGRSVAARRGEAQRRLEREAGPDFTR